MGKAPYQKIVSLCQHSFDRVIPILAMVLLPGFVLGCGHNKEPDTMRDRSEQLSVPGDELLDQGWTYLRSGNVEKAEAFFRECESQHGFLGGCIEGLFAVARAKGDAAAAKDLIELINTNNSDRKVVVKAAQLCRNLDAVDAHALRIMRSACEFPDEAFGENKNARREICASLTFREKISKILVHPEDSPFEIDVPLFFAGASPVVFLSINGQPPQPFIVDTGASSSVLTRRYADEIGISEIPGTEYTVTSSSGEIQTSIRAADIDIQEKTIKNVPFAIMDLPLENIRGILSPHTVFNKDVVLFDFRSFRFAVSPSYTNRNEETNHDFISSPFYRYENNPILNVRLGESSRYPFVLDTGAIGTVIFKPVDIPLQTEDSEKIKTVSAGNRESEAWKIKETISARIQNYDWEMVTPTIKDIHYKRMVDQPLIGGLLGADFFMGRIVVLDNPANEIRFSEQVTFDGWEKGNTYLFAVKDERFEGESFVRETIVSKNDKSITFEVEITRGSSKDRFRYSMKKNWKSRGSWLVTHPIETLWKPKGDVWVKSDIKDASSRWLKVFRPFRSLGSNIKNDFVLKQWQGRELGCTRLSMDAIVEGIDAILTIETCPNLAFRTIRVALERKTDQSSIWEMVQQP